MSNETQTVNREVVQKQYDAAGAKLGNLCKNNRSGPFADAILRPAIVLLALLFSYGRKLGKPDKAIAKFANVGLTTIKGKPSSVKVTAGVERYIPAVPSDKWTMIETACQEYGIEMPQEVEPPKGKRGRKTASVQEVAADLKSKKSKEAFANLIGELNAIAQEVEPKVDAPQADAPQVKPAAKGKGKGKK